MEEATSERIYQNGERPQGDCWYVWDAVHTGTVPCRYAICGPSGAVEAWTHYEETARLIVWALNKQHSERSGD